MIRFLNQFGGEMWVAEERAEEYKAAGYKPAVSSGAEPTKRPANEADKKTAAKRTVKKKE